MRFLLDKVFQHTFLFSSGFRFCINNVNDPLQQTKRRIEPTTTTTTTTIVIIIDDARAARAVHRRIARRRSAIGKVHRFGLLLQGAEMILFFLSYYYNIGDEGTTE
jgi:hypothetical protein